MRKKTNTAFFAGIALILVAGSFYYTWKMIIPKYTEDKTKSVSLDTSIAEANKKLDSLKKAQTTLTQLGDIPTQLSVAVPEDKDMPNLITELEAVAAKSGMILPTIAVSDGSSATPAAGTTPVAVAATGNAITISIATPGTFETINSLISDLEKDIRFMNIKSVSISSATDDKGAVTMTVSLQIEAYKRGTPVAAAATATPAATE